MVGRQVSENSPRRRRRIEGVAVDAAGEKDRHLGMAYP
jgi:hypothetical protein